MKFIELHDTDGNLMLLDVTEIKQVMKRNCTVIIFGEHDKMIVVQEACEEIRNKLLIMEQRENRQNYKK